MTQVCPSCGCFQPDALLCHEDTSAIETMLAAAPQLVDELQVAINKQAVIGDGGKAGKGSAHERSPVNWGAVAVRDALLVELALWGNDIDAIRKHPQAAEIASGIGKAVKNAYRCIDRMQDRQYLGQCLAEENGLICHAEVWVKPGAHQVKCSQCHTVHDVPDRRASLLQQAEDLIVTPKEASNYIGEVGEIKVGQQQIRNYVDRKRIPKRPSADGLMRLRMGDLLEILRRDTETRNVRAS